ncbi:MAG: alpha-1,2-fucosyltransferase [Austwickia sp.]|nr:alpha-1,2-fucosyltransferase [Austwickia sp.]
MILTRSEELLELPNARLALFGGSWTDELPPSKRFEVSYLYSPGAGGRQLRGYVDRARVWQMREQIGALGRWYTSAMRPPSVADPHPYPFASKLPLFESMFSVVIENEYERHYFTEKLIDAVRTYTVPIYLGCPNIEDFFDPRGMMVLDSVDQLVAAVQQLSPQDYWNRMPYLADNYARGAQFLDPLETIRVAVDAAYREGSRSAQNARMGTSQTAAIAKSSKEQTGPVPSTSQGGDMTIVQLEGGLGSQMFGYAAARALALRHGADVYLDLRQYRYYKKHLPQLHHFDVAATVLTNEQADELCGPDDSLVTSVRPRHLHVDHAILSLSSPHVLLRGDYLSQDYFHDAVDVIRKDFRRITPPSAHAVSVAHEIQQCRQRGLTPVAVHVRRGDYVSESDVLAVHGLCTPQYYSRARSLMSRLVEHPWYFVFSNDPAFAATLDFGPTATVVSTPETDAPVEDMMLMAQCDEHIIANSSYSWWGAWLTDRKDHVVIVPRPFLADRSLNAEDWIPRDWIGLGTQPEL